MGHGLLRMAPPFANNPTLIYSYNIILICNTLHTRRCYTLCSIWFKFPNYYYKRLLFSYLSGRCRAPFGFDSNLTRNRLPYLCLSILQSGDQFYSIQLSRSHSPTQAYISTMEARFGNENNNDNHNHDNNDNNRNNIVNANSPGEPTLFTVMPSIFHPLPAHHFGCLHHRRQIALVNVARDTRHRPCIDRCMGLIERRLCWLTRKERKVL